MACDLGVHKAVPKKMEHKEFHLHQVLGKSNLRNTSWKVVRARPVVWREQWEWPGLLSSAYRGTWGHQDSSNWGQCVPTEKARAP